MFLLWPLETINDIVPQNAHFQSLISNCSTSILTNYANATGVTSGSSTFPCSRFISFSLKFCQSSRMFTPYNNFTNFCLKTTVSANSVFGLQCKSMGISVLTIRQRSWGKVVFSQVLVCPQDGRGGYPWSHVLSRQHAGISLTWKSNSTKCMGTNVNILFCFQLKKLLTGTSRKQHSTVEEKKYMRMVPSHNKKLFTFSRISKIFSEYKFLYKILHRSPWCFEIRP